MDELIKEVEDLLSKYNITIYEAIRIYEKNQKQTRRLTQFYENTEDIVVVEVIVITTSTTE